MPKAVHRYAGVGVWGCVIRGLYVCMRRRDCNDDDVDACSFHGLVPQDYKLLLEYKIGPNIY